MSESKTKAKLLETVTPVGMRVLVRKDESRSETRGGIILPDDSKIPVITARVLEIGDAVSNDMDYAAIQQYAKVLVNPSRSIPVDFEDDKRFIVPVEDIVAVFGKDEG